jgi:hypothetical protein
MTFASPSATAAVRFTAQAAPQMRSGLATSPQPAASKSAAPTDGPARRSSADSTQQRRMPALVTASVAPAAAESPTTAPPPSAASTPSLGLAVAAGSLRQSAAAALAALTVAGQLVPASAAAVVAQQSLDLPAVVREVNGWALVGGVVGGLVAIAGICISGCAFAHRDSRRTQREQDANASSI